MHSSKQARGSSTSATIDSKSTNAWARFAPRLVQPGADVQSVGGVLAVQQATHHFERAIQITPPRCRVSATPSRSKPPKLESGSPYTVSSAPMERTSPSVVMDDRQNRLSVARAQEVPVARRNVDASDVTRSTVEAEDFLFEGTKVRPRQAPLVNATRHVQEVQVRTRRHGRHSVHDAAALQERQIEGFAVERDEQGGALHELGEPRQERAFLAGFFEQELLEHEGAILGEPAQTEEKRDRPPLPPRPVVSVSKKSARRRSKPARDGSSARSESNWLSASVADVAARPHLMGRAIPSQAAHHETGLRFVGKEGQLASSHAA